VKNWGYSIKDVIDISHDNPVYDSRALERGGIHYQYVGSKLLQEPTSNQSHQAILMPLSYAVSFLQSAKFLRQVMRLMASSNWWIACVKSRKIELLQKIGANITSE